MSMENLQAEKESRMEFVRNRGTEAIKKELDLGLEANAVATLMAMASAAGNASRDNFEMAAKLLASLPKKRTH